MEPEKIKILAIDDNPDNLISIKALIREAFSDALVFSSLSGEEGIEIAVGEDPDVILLDIVMPGMDGFDVCEKLKADKKLRDIPVVFVTAIKGDKENRIRALECGAEAFLAKPIDESELTAQIRAMVKIKRANVDKHNERERLESLVNERTSQLNDAFAATLKLLENLRTEVAAREKNEETLRQSEERFRAVAQSAKDAIITTNDKGMILEWNKGAEKIFGFTEDEISGKEFSLILPGEYITSYETGVTGGSQSDADQIVGKTTELRGLHKNGKEFPIELSLAEWETSTGRFFTGIIRDITERRFSEDALQELNKKLIRAQRVAHIGSWENYLPTNELTWSAEMYSIMGFSPDTPLNLGKTSCVFPPEEFERLQQAVTLAIDENVPYRMDYKIVRTDGAIRYIHDEGEVIRDENGNAVRMFGTTQDITDRKHTELELIVAKEHAEESDRLKSAFLANMSHEIRTPMNGILGFAGLLKEPRLTGEEQQEYISIIEKSGTRMLSIINDIISISKVESGQMCLSIEPTNLNEQIDYIYTFFKPETEQKGLQLFFKKSLPSDRAIINTDREKVYAILTNLVKNAIKFSDKGIIEFGYTVVETRHAETGHAEIGHAEDKETRRALSLLTFFVKDSGIGIPDNRQKAIFDRFVQADIGDKRAFQGAGLGLAISKAYVEMLGGKIWVESEEGKGSCFYFTLPYNHIWNDETEMANGGIASEDVNQIDSQGSGLKILIAEDDETSKALITLGLRTVAKSILKAKTGIEAVDICRKNSDIDLVLMDIKMPEMNGYEATRLIRQFDKDVIIIAQTAYALAGDREKAIEAGCNDYIAKPFGRTTLNTMINKYF